MSPPPQDGITTLLAYYSEKSGERDRSFNAAGGFETVVQMWKESGLTHTHAQVLDGGEEEGGLSSL